MVLLKHVQNLLEKVRLASGLCHPLLVVFLDGTRGAELARDPPAAAPDLDPLPDPGLGVDLPPCAKAVTVGARVHGGAAVQPEDEEEELDVGDKLDIWVGQGEAELLQDEADVGGGLADIIHHGQEEDASVRPRLVTQDLAVLVRIVDGAGDQQLAASGVGRDEEALVGDVAARHDGLDELGHVLNVCESPDHIIPIFVLKIIRIVKLKSKFRLLLGTLTNPFKNILRTLSNTLGNIGNT